jgi:translation initiation factor IF-3
VPVPRRFDRRPPERDTTRINERIRVPQVRLIGADGEQLGIVDTSEALRRAQEADLDLVEVAANSKPPVTRMLDYSKYKYEQEQKQKAARKHQQQVNIREIKLRPKIATHDYDTKKGHVERFLKHGDKVKITIMFRGREQAHPERGRALLQKLFEDLGGLAVIESAPLQEGRNMSMLLAPSKEARAAEEAAAAPAAGEADSTPAAPAEADSTPAEADTTPAEADTTPAATSEADSASPAPSEDDSEAPAPAEADSTAPAAADGPPAAS